MRELEYALLSAQNMTDPKQRSLMLISTIVKQARVIELMARVLREAEAASNEIEDPTAREKALLALSKAKGKVGYDPERRIFHIHPTAKQNGS